MAAKTGGLYFMFLGPPSSQFLDLLLICSLPRSPSSATPAGFLIAKMLMRHFTVIRDENMEV